MNPTALAIAIGAVLWSNASLLAEEPIAQAGASSGSLDGLAFWLETIDGGYLFSVHRHQGAWSVISGASRNGNGWTTKVIESAEFNDAGALVFDHSPGLHLENPIPLPIKEFQLLSKEGSQPRVYVDGIRVVAEFFPAPEEAIFAAMSQEAAIRAAHFTLGSEYREQPTEIRELETHWVLLFDLKPEEFVRGDPGILVEIHKPTGLVEIRLPPDGGEECPGTR